MVFDRTHAGFAQCLPPSGTATIADGSSAHAARSTTAATPAAARRKAAVLAAMLEDGPACYASKGVRLRLRGKSSGFPLRTELRSRLAFTSAPRRLEHQFLLCVTFLTQGAFKKFVQSQFDRTKIIARIASQEAATSEGVNFRFA